MIFYSKKSITYCTVVIITLTILLIIYSHNNYNDHFNELVVHYENDYDLVKSNEHKLFDISFEYLINNEDVCNKKLNSTTNGEILAVIIVTSYFGNIETRSAMRRSFSKNELEELGIRRLFLLGIAHDNDYVTQRAVEDENKRFRDIIQGNFKEAYRNLTYKHMMGIKWVATYCQRAQYVIKMDDDIVFNLQKVVDLLKNEKWPRTNLLAGYILKGLNPVREPANKWYVTQDEYKHSRYPTFLSGWFYVTYPQICARLYNLSTKIRYFWIDDVYVTGLLAQMLGIKHYSLNKYFTVHPENLQCCMRDILKSNTECELLIGPNGGDNNLFYSFSKANSKCLNKKCTKRSRPLNETCVAEKIINLRNGNAIIESYLLS